MNDPVVIAGGGPTGLMLAIELRLAGIPVVVVEPRTEIEESSCGMAVHGRTLEVMRQRGLEDDLRAEGLFAWPRTPFALLWLDLGSIGEEDYTFGLPQWRTERVLARRADDTGADIRRGQRVVGCAEHDAGVRVTVRMPDGDEVVDAAYLVGCDGPDSTVRELAGIALDSHPSSDYYGVLGDVEVAEGEQFEAGIHEGGVFGAIPIGPDTLRLMTIEFDRPSVHTANPVDEAELSASIERITGRTPKFRTVRYLARYGRPTAVARSYRRGRLLLAGDAAHVYFVSGTQALNTGIQDVVNLGWKLAAAVRGDAPAGLLDTYEAERQPSALRASVHSRAQMALMHPLAKVEPLRELFGQLLRFDEVNQLLLRMPSESPKTSGADAHPLVGTRIGSVALVGVDRRTTVAEALRGGRGLVLSFAGHAPDVAGWTDRVELVEAKPVAGVDTALVLVRPDGVVGWAGSDPAELTAALRTFFGEPR